MLKKLNYSLSWNSLGTAYFNMKNDSQAIDSYKKALSIDPNFIDAKLNLAAAYCQSGDYVNASLLYQNLIQHDPKNINYSVTLASVYVNNKDYQTAKNVIKALLTNNPDANSDISVKNIILMINNKSL